MVEIDDQGNAGAGGVLSHTRFVDIVIEDAPPLDPLTIDVPDDIVVSALPGEPGIEVEFAAATAEGGVPPITIACDHASGHYFPVGVTTVTCTAEDSAPDELIFFTLVSASFTVTVLAVDDPDDPDTPGQPGGPSTPGAGGLPATGAEPAGAIVLALALLAAGIAALRISRRFGRRV